MSLSRISLASHLEVSALMCSSGIFPTHRSVTIGEEKRRKRMEFGRDEPGGGGGNEGESAHAGHDIIGRSDHHASVTTWLQHAAGNDNPHNPARDAHSRTLALSLRLPSYRVHLSPRRLSLRYLQPREDAARVDLSCCGAIPRVGPKWKLSVRWV